MDESGRAAWLNEALTEVLVAFAESSTLVGRLIYKGARILDQRLSRTERASLDIDANLTADFVTQFPTREQQRAELEQEIAQSIAWRIRKHDPIRYRLEQVRVVLHPAHAHPLGFDAFKVFIRLHDYRQPNVLGIPTIEIDIVAPESLRAASVAPLMVGENTVQAYTLTRIAGEKLRALLQSLPDYCSKMKRPGTAVRAKDVYDLARIVDAHPISDTAFWRSVGEEFVEACRSRFVDCADETTFEQELAVTQRSYETDSTIPDDRSWETAFRALREITGFLAQHEFLGRRYPLPNA
jgi:hypothetical protein